MSKQKKSGVLQARFFAAFLLFSLGNSSFAEVRAAPVPTLAYKVLRTLPHDSTHFTQGLVLRKKRLYESAGGYGRSSLHIKDVGTGRSEKQVTLPADIFAEGLAELGSELFMLSWRGGRGYVFDLQLRERRRFQYQGEGWGLTAVDGQLVMSNGSASLRWLDAARGTVTKEVTVRAGATPVQQLNELEYAHGLVYANIWHSDRIALIEPASGQVRAWVDLGALRQQMPKPAQWNAAEHVLNGIAHDPERDLFYVTGKCWPQLFELRIDALPNR